jgi:hypothetical protein
LTDLLTNKQAPITVRVHRIHPSCRIPETNLGRETIMGHLPPDTPEDRRSLTLVGGATACKAGRAIMEHRRPDILKGRRSLIPAEEATACRADRANRAVLGSGTRLSGLQFKDKDHHICHLTGRGRVTSGIKGREGIL